MPEIKISIPDFSGDVSKRLSSLESALRTKSDGGLSRDLAEIRRIVSSKDSSLDRRLARIESMVAKIPDVMRTQAGKLGDKISGISFESKSEIPQIRRIVGESTTQILDMLSKHEKPVDNSRTMRKMEDSLEKMERKLARFSLPKNVFITVHKGQTVVPSPS